MREQSKVVVHNSVLFGVIIQLHRRLKSGLKDARVVAISTQVLWRTGHILSQSYRTLTQSQQSSDSTDTKEDLAQSASSGMASQNDGVQHTTVLQSSILVKLLTQQAESDTVAIDLRDARLIGPIVLLIERTGNRLLERSDTIPPTATVLRFGYQTWHTFFQHPIRTVSLGLIPVVLSLLVWQVITSTTLGLGSLGLLVLLLLSALGTQKKESWEGVKSYRSAADEPRATVQSWVNNSLLLRPFDSYRLVFLFAGGYLVVGLSRVLSLGSDAAIELFSFVILVVGLIVVFWSYTEPPADL